MDDTITKIAGYIAIAVPVTVAISNIAMLILEWLNQNHLIRTAVVQQNHQITTQYLDKALDPQVPLAIRHQLLRFLSTPDNRGDRLSAWAASELRRIGTIIDEVNSAVTQAEKALNKATTPSQVEAAERKLIDAVKRQKTLTEAPPQPAITAAALRAEMIPDRKLNALAMPNSDLKGMRLQYRELRGADFSGCDLSGANFQGSDLRTASFAEAKILNAVFYDADLRGADFSGSVIEEANFQKARLEGANLASCSIKRSDLRATYDDNTNWPKDFNPTDSGAVYMPKAAAAAATEIALERKDG